MSDDNRLDAVDRELLRILQSEFPLEVEPFLSIARRLAITQDEVLSRVDALKKRKIIRRIGGVFDQSSLGYKSVLAAMNVPEERLESVASRVSSFREVTHNYSRKHRYNLWFTVTAASDDRLEEVVKSVEQFSGLPVSLFKARKTFKVRAVFEV